METRQRLPVFPVLLAAVWITLSAYTLFDFAGFAGATRPAQAPAALAMARTPADAALPASPPAGCVPDAGAGALTSRTAQ